MPRLTAIRHCKRFYKRGCRSHLPAFRGTGDVALQSPLRERLRKGSGERLFPCTAAEGGQEEFRQPCPVGGHRRLPLSRGAIATKPAGRRPAGLPDDNQRAEAGKTRRESGAEFAILERSEKKAKDAARRGGNLSGVAATSRFLRCSGIPESFHVPPAGRARWGA